MTVPDDINQAANESITVPAVSVPAAAVLKASAETVLQSINAMVINDAVLYKLGGDELSRVKALRKQIEEERVEKKREFLAACRDVDDRYGVPLEYLDRAVDALDTKLIGYSNEQKRKADAERVRQEAAAAAERKRLADEAAEAQRKADAQARAEREKIEAEERARREAEAAAERELQRIADAKAEKLAAEGKAKAAAAARERADREAKERAEQFAREEADRKAQAEKDAAIQKARADADAEALRQQAASVAVVRVADNAPSAAGLSIAGTWKGRVPEKMKLMAFVVANPFFEFLFDVNESQLNTLARQKKEGLAAAIPGTESYLEQHTRNTGRR